ncbi:hypothetical protein ACNI3K_08850 [Demequina sp. SO4-13]|uniref:hypothetical protein n=1 Tax=Demequina sp. SO4-13 TaxID=3401027 RepID=UPI003AF9716E
MQAAIAIWNRDALREECGDGSRYSPLFGVRFYCNAAGDLERLGGLPPVVYDDGVEEWWFGGDLHREGAPARIAREPGEVLYVEPDVDGLATRDHRGRPVRRRHRLSGLPESEQAVEEWYINGRLSREDGPARVHADGTLEFWSNGVRNRTSGPAIQYPRPYAGWASGPDEYWQRGALHRIDGPAREPFVSMDGFKATNGEYFLRGQKFDDVRSRWSVLRHYTEAADRPTLAPDNAEAWSALVDAGAVDVARQEIDPIALAVQLRLHPN